MKVPDKHGAAFLSLTLGALSLQLIILLSLLQAEPGHM